MMSGFSLSFPDRSQQFGKMKSALQQTTCHKSNEVMRTEEKKDAWSLPVILKCWDETQNQCLVGITELLTAFLN